MHRRLIGIFVLLATCGVQAAEEKVDFNRDVRPILSENCYFCHGPDKDNRKSGLRLDTKEGSLEKLQDGSFAIVPGKPAQSMLYQRITHKDIEERMPQQKSEKRLTAAEIETLRKWIEQGAEYQPHWAYIAPLRTAVPNVKNTKWVRNEFDNFVLARLEKDGLRPAAEADKVTLIRRLNFDLIGLPPEPAEVQAFLKDSSEKAYENLVDRLLAAPQYGERMALHWLDLVRFADTAGYHSDNDRNITPYRDYVIQAFNENKPFDKFTVEQLAGDMLPNSTLNQKVASGYNRLLQTTEEGGAQAKEYRAKYAADRVRNVSSVWMGSTMGCCECHDHKFDPFSAKDFYRVAAFFADVKEADLGRREAGMPVPTEAQNAELKKLDEAIAPLKKVVETATPELAAAQKEWEEAQKTRVMDWVTLKPETMTTKSGAKLSAQDDGAILASGTVPDGEVYTLAIPIAMKDITAIRLEVLPDKALPKGGPGRSSNGNFVLNDFQLQAGGKKVAWGSVTATHSQTDFDISKSIDADAKSGWAILNEINKPHHAVFETPAGFDAGTSITLIMDQSYGSAHAIGRFRIAATAAPRPVKAGKTGLPPEVSAVLAIEAEKRNDAQKNTLANYYRTVAPLLEGPRGKLAENEKQKAELLKKVPTSLVSEAGTPREIRVLPRGNWMDDSGEVMQPGVPHFLKQIDAKGRATRLDLANWLVAKENPLTARVFVNRIWKLYFGTGISKILDDLGAQGEWPTHPELLDYMAVDFSDGGWNVKGLLKKIVMSSTYRQSSQSGKELREKDPYNRLLARQSRFRLDAEIVRDNALAISGILVKTIGGGSVKPYQPDGYWQHLNFPTRSWKHDSGENEYRRGLYTFWQRSFLHPSLLAFDAPSREECTADRPRSNTPQQALVLLNDPTYVEAARVLAEHTMKSGKSVEERLHFAYQRALSRKANAEEVKLQSALYQKHLERFTADKKAAEALVKTGEWPVPKDLDVSEFAAWTSITRVILNLHETITRD